MDTQNNKPRRTLSEDHKRKIGEALKGRKGHAQTDEHRRKMSEGMKSFWAKIKNQ